MTLTVPQHNIKIINFDRLFIRIIEPEILDQIESFGLIRDSKINIKNKHVKRLFYHYVIYDLCSYILSVKGKERVIVYYDKTTVPGGHLHNYMSALDLKTFFNSLMVKVTKMLPIKFLCGKITFRALRTEIRDRTGEGLEILSIIESIISKFDTSKYTFAKIRQFAKRYGLDYLSNNFFQQIKSKQLILR
jgi:hypothetical protein